METLNFLPKESIIRHFNLPNNSENVGNDFATHYVSSIMTGPSAPSSATLNAITILWS